MDKVNYDFLTIVFDISNINLERVFIFQRYIIAILILLPALIIGYLMLEFNKLFTQKIAPIIRLLYIVSLSFMTAIFEANKFPVEYILIIIAGFLGVIGSVITLIKKYDTNTGELLVLISMSINIFLFFVW
ncbi:hypothetical protein [Intestinibacter bartlettii]|uniref:hypothetical protein n=1 Tax=Intestinibacter bartlettii TaxID=261299 RepID=UPI00319E363D